MDRSEDDPSGFRLADWEVDPPTNRVIRGEEEVKLEPKVMAVLVYLASRPGETVSRHALESAVWTGTVVSYDAVTGAIQKLRKVFGDDRANPRFIETLSKKGYRLVAPVSPRESPPHSRSSQPTKDRGVSERRSHRAALFAVAAIVGLIIATTLVWIQNRGTVRDSTGDAGNPKSIAVLPFRDFAAHPVQDFFAEGMTDDLISALARFSDLQIIARDSTFFYRDSPLELRDLADKLNARYLLRGSVQREEDRVRIMAELVDAHSGKTLWAERFDDEAVRLFELQDRMTHRIVAALAGRLNIRDRQELSRPRTKNLEAYDHFLIGRQRFFRYANAEENWSARESFERSIALDPGFDLAYAMLAWTHAFDAMNGWTRSREGSLKRALELATEAIELDEAMPVAYFVRGLAYRELGNRVRALVQAEQAIAYDPNYAGAQVLLATLLYFAVDRRKGWIS